MTEQEDIILNGVDEDGHFDVSQLSHDILLKQSSQGVATKADGNITSWDFDQSFFIIRPKIMIFSSCPIHKRLFRALMLVIKGWCYAD